MRYEDHQKSKLDYSGSHNSPTRTNDFWEYQTAKCVKFHRFPKFFYHVEKFWPLLKFWGGRERKRWFRFCSWDQYTPSRGPMGALVDGSRGGYWPLTYRPPWSNIAIWSISKPTWLLTQNTFTRKAIHSTSVIVLPRVRLSAKFPRGFAIVSTLTKNTKRPWPTSWMVCDN